MPSVPLAAYVVRLRATQPEAILHHMGRAVHQFLFSLLPPALAAELHANKSGPQPFTVSGLLMPDCTRPLANAQVRAGDAAWFRLVGLQAGVVAALEGFAEAPPPTIELDYSHWDVE